MREAEVLEACSVLEHPVDGEQDRVGDCDGCALAAAASSETVIVRREEVRLARESLPPVWGVILPPPLGGQMQHIWHTRKIQDFHGLSLLTTQS
jgi:hypothetical protein